MAAAGAAPTAAIALGTDTSVRPASTALKGLEYIMRIMDTVGVSRFSELEGKYVRVATKGWGDIIKIIGNVIKDQWFDPEAFFKDGKE